MNNFNHLNFLAGIVDELDRNNGRAEMTYPGKKHPSDKDCNERYKK